MTTYYYLRNAEGHLKARIGAKVMAKMTSECPGFWREYTPRGQAPSACYEFSEDMTFGADEFAMYLWKGDILVPVD